MAKKEQLILKRGTCSTCASKVRETTTNPQGVEEVKIYCRKGPPQTITLKVLTPVASLGPNAGQFPPGSLIEQVYATQSNFPFVRPDWWCESWAQLSRVPGQGIAAGTLGEDINKGEGEA